MIEFQIYDFVEDHEKIEEYETESGSEEKNNVPELPKYIIHVFGRTEDDKSVYCKVKGFTPFFYIALPPKWDKKSIKRKMSIMYDWFTGTDNKKVWKKFRQGLLSVRHQEAMDAYGFQDSQKKNFAMLTFDNTFALKKFKYMLEQNKISIPGATSGAVQFKTYEANLPPMLRWSHIQKISGCSWVCTDDFKKIENDEDKDSYCDIELEVTWTNLNPIEKDFNAPIRIASFDIECNSVDGQFPQARRKGDACIQIGTTYTHLGESLPYRQHIVCLNSTDPVENCVTESYDNERDLVLAWKNEIIKSDCDIITGYNIFFFDEKYIYDRAELHLNLKYELSLISKLKDFECKFRDFKLASSSLGENQIRMWDTPGRVHVDLMKDVQKTYNLSSYKLDSVSSNFIRGKINNPEKLKKSKKSGSKDYRYLLHCEQVDDIMVDDYIHIEHMKNFVSDYIGKKYIVKDLDRDKKTLLIESDIEINNVDEGSLFWSQAKDDVGPQDIFRLQKGNSSDRSIVAKYCVKDCRLVNLLVNKLEVITKNIEMANVCYVPLSYLFVRGQGVKLFSLCMKAFREEKYFFPVLTKKEDKDSGYEGAIVFDPVPNVYYQPLVTKDYASLYPSSIIHKNMSHETMIGRNSEYDNLPGVKYYNSQFKEFDGTIKNVRFAQRDDKPGVVPMILQNLLGERKAVKKLMKTEKDPFKYKILDAKQLALKITANSLYGQLGAPTSPIYLKAIAACTTSTGREMLILAKKYDEEILPGFLNGIKYAALKEDNESVDKLIKMELKSYDDEKLVKKIKDYVINLDSSKILFQPIIRYGDTDSIFSCYRFQENCKSIKKEKSIVKWEKLIEFSKFLMGFFIPEEYKDLWDSLHDEYYGKEKIDSKLILPKSPETEPIPEHYSTIQPIEVRLKQFIKEYMEESFLPWMWTLQELYLYYEEKIDPKLFGEIVTVKLYKWGEHQLEKIRNITFSPPWEVDSEFNIEDPDIDPIAIIKAKNQKEIEIKQTFEQDIREFFQGYMRDVFIEPYWSVKNDKRIKVKFWKGGSQIIDKNGLDLSIEMGVITGETVKKRLPYPHDLEYEKTFWPFLILTKKRYVGNKYEFDSEKFKKDFMGIVLKRRDNAPIVKEICNGIIDSLINHKDPEKARNYTKDCIAKMFNNEYDINYFLTSKTLKLKESYKDWTKIGHVVLAERIGIRDPGNKPQSGDRIEFAAVKIPNKTKETLQGDMIETPKFISEKNLDLDYVFYMTNQIMNPALQFLDLAIKNAQKDIFDKYIFVDKMQELIKEKRELFQYLKKELEGDNIIFDSYFYEAKTTNELELIIDEVKKEIRKLKSEKRKYDKLKEKEMQSAEVDV